MEVFTLAALAALVVKATSVLKFARAGQWGDVGTQVVAWAIGAGLALLAAAANAMANIDVNGVALGDLDKPSAVLLGFALASVGSFAYDYKKARDATTSAAEPPLMPRANRPLRAHREAGLGVLGTVLVVVVVLLVLGYCGTR